MCLEQFGFCYDIPNSFGAGIGHCDLFYANLSLECSLTFLGVYLSYFVTWDISWVEFHTVEETLMWVE